MPTYPSSGPGVYAWAVEVAGLARKHGTFASNGQRIRPMALTTTATQPAATRLDVYQPVLVDGSVSMTSQACNPLTGAYTASRVSFAVVCSDTACPEVAAFFLAPRNARSPFALGTAAFGPNDIAVDLATVNGSNLSDHVTAGDVIYNGREALRVSSVNDGAGQVFVVDRAPDPTAADPTYAGDVTRSTDGTLGDPSHIGTTREQHEIRASVAALPPVPDERWYSSNPFVSGREVTLYRCDGVNTEVVWWRGIIDGDPTLDDDGATLRISCTDILTAMRRVRFNRRAPVWVVRNAVQYAPDGDFRFYTLQSEVVDATTAGEFREASVWAAPAASGATLPAPAALQVGKMGAFCPSYAINDSSSGGVVVNASRIKPATVWGGDPTPALGSFSSVVGQRVYELLVSDPLDDASPVTGGTGITPENHPYWCVNVPDPATPGTTTSGILRHPLHMVLAHLGRLACPNLPRDRWVLPLPADYVDTDTVLELAGSTYGFIDAWPGVVAGIDGKDVGALEWLESTFLRPLGAGFAFTRDSGSGSSAYRLTVRSLFFGAQAGDVTVDASTLLPDRPARSAGELATDYVVAECGTGIAGQPRLQIVGDSLYQQRFFPYRSQPYTLERVGIAHPDTQATAAFVASPSIVMFRRMLSTIAALFRYPLNIIPRRITYGAPVQAGDLVTVTDIGGRSEADGSVSTDDKPGFVLERSIDLSPSGAMTQTISVLVLPYDIRRIGPAARVATGSTSTDVVCEAAVYIQPIPSGGTYQPTATRSASKDVEQFAVGQVVRVYSAGLEPLTDPVAVSSINAGSNTLLLSAPLAALGGGAYVPVAGDVVAVGALADVDATSSEQLAFFGRDTYAI